MSKLKLARNVTVRKCNQNILEALELAKKLIILSDEGEAASEDDSCSVLYGIIRDCAYRIRDQAERERVSHVDQGRWG